MKSVATHLRMRRRTRSCGRPGSSRDEIRDVLREAIRNPGCCFTQHLIFAQTFQIPLAEVPGLYLPVRHSPPNGSRLIRFAGICCQEMLEQRLTRLGISSSEIAVNSYRMIPVLFA